MRTGRKNQRGQALVMVTLGLVSMFGIMALAVDIGWSYYVEKSAQAAADAAALAAVSAAMASSPATYTCGTLACAPTPVACPGVSGNLAAACYYASQNGFSANARQTVTVQASDANTAPTVNGCTPLVTHPPTAPCVDTPYWVTVRVSEQVPQLFAAVLGRTMGTVSARATAAVARSEAIGSLILLNRQANEGPGSNGVNLNNNGGPDVNVPGGIILAANSPTAGYAWGSSDVVSPFTYVQSGGARVVGGSATWDPAPVTRSDGAPFYDPFRNRPQVPINSNQSSLPNIPVPETNGGVAELTNTVCPGGVCPPGNYYAAKIQNGAYVPTGNPITINAGNSGQMQFAGGGTNFANGDYVFFGGMKIRSGTVDFGAGRYVFAGVRAAGDPVFSVDNGVTLNGGTGGDSDPGRAFIFTDDSYEGRLDSTASGIGALPDLQFGHVFMQAGQNDRSRVELHGLNPANSQIQALNLEDYPVAMWQDRKNSNVKYTYNGNIDVSCGTLNAPCTNTNSTSRGLTIQASPYARYGGVIYQPRGAWLTMNGGGTSTGALQIITGALNMTGGGNITLSSPTTPVTTMVAALVE